VSSGALAQMTGGGGGGNVSIRQHTSAYVGCARTNEGATSAYVSIRQHSSSGGGGGHPVSLVKTKSLVNWQVRSYKSLEEEEEAILSAFRVFDKENTGICAPSILVY
jgi:hypothetical protein